ncbi:MAG: hypothetical protein AAF968_13620 [Pseudomonadota bacterium]
MNGSADIASLSRHRGEPRDEERTTGKPSSVERPGRPDSWIAAGAALLVLGAGVFGLWKMSERIAGLEAALAERPAIRLADYSAISEAVAAGHDPQAILPLMVDLKRQTADLGEAGVLVINRAMVEGHVAALTVAPDPALVATLMATARPAIGTSAAAAPTPERQAAPRTPMSEAEAAALLRALTEGR